MRAIKKIKGIMFNIHEAIWWVVAEIEDWLYPYHDRLTPEEKFEIRVKDPVSGEDFMVEQHIQGLNEKISRLQDQMMDVNAQLQEHERRLKTRIQPRGESSSVSGKVKGMFE
jgi:hypothetical protein